MAATIDRRTAFALLACVLLLSACNRAAPASRGAPVILISVDTLRADRLPAYGYQRIATPAFDRLAKDGIVFENAYAHVPLTLPSHVTIMSGTLPWQTGVRSNIGYSFAPGNTSTLPKLLSGHGYITGAAVSSYVLRRETGLGQLFDSYDDSLQVAESAALGALQRSGDATVRAALSWLDRAGKRPFLLFLHLYEPHSPYEPAEPFRAQYSNPYDGEVATTDAILGRFFAELDRRGLYEGALIVLLSDHGEGLGDHGESEHGVLLNREALHVPLIVKLPGNRLAGQQVDEPAQLIDVLPTIVSAVGAKVPAGLAGTSLIDLATGRGPKARTIYSETLYPRLHLGWSALRSLIDSRFQYIESPSPELFDVIADPAETRNLRDERRRESSAMARQLSQIPLRLEPPGAADPEERARLAALGYLSGGASDSGARRRNPRDHIQVLDRVQKTFALNREGRYRESVELCRAILRDYPEMVDVYTQLAANLRRLGRFEEALETYREAIRRSPQLVDSLATEIAKVELDLGNLAAAGLYARQGLKLNPAEAHLMLAGVALERRDLAAAAREARQALGDEDRPRIPALIMLARVLVEQGKLEEALEVTDRVIARAAVEHGPPVAMLACTRGDILARLGRTKEAEAAFRQEIAQFPASRIAYIRLAILLAAEHRFAAIEPTLDAMVRASPTPSTYRLAARAMSDFGNEEGARSYRKRGELLAKESGVGRQSG